MTPLPFPLGSEPVLLMIAPNYVSLGFSLFTIQMLLKADCLLLCAVNPGCLLKHNLMIVYYHLGLSAVSLLCRLPAVSRGDHETRSPSQQQ